MICRAVLLLHLPVIVSMKNEGTAVVLYKFSLVQAGSGERTFYSA